MRPEAKTLLRTSALVLVVALVLLPARAGAVCPNTVETDEQALWNVHNCWPAFRDWFRPYFNLQSDHWNGGWGWPTCDPTQAFPKMWNSAYLLTYGLEDWYLGPWHSDLDYYRWAAGSQHGFRFEPEDTCCANYAQAFWGAFTTDRVEMDCPSFNNYTAGVRAGVMLHESTHHIYKNLSHMSNPPGSNCGVPCSDDWYFHFLNSYPYGSLAGHTHSMAQMQIEYNCDLAEFGEWWVPYTIGIVAQSESNSYMVNRIRNPPGWTCGQPRPLYNPQPPASNMQPDSAVRGCSNYSEWPPVYQPDADACYSYCAQNGANACEWYVNGDCYVEFGNGCYVQGGFSGWSAAVF